MATVEVDSKKIRELFKERGINVNVASKMMGYAESTLSARISQGKMSEEMLEKIAYLFSVEKETLLSSEIMEQPLTDNIISYICDIGKIQTDMLRELKELHNDTKTLFTALNTNVIDMTSELHQTTENVKNHSVATNQNMNKIHNLMKYGGK